MRKDNGPVSIENILIKKVTKRPPAYKWQELALRIIQDLSIPAFKRSAVFRICKQYPKERVEKAMNDTKELCQSGLKWKYFFKVMADDKEKKDAPKN